MVPSFMVRSSYGADFWFDRRSQLGEVRGVREALGATLRVVRLAVPLFDIQRRLVDDVPMGAAAMRHGRRH
jgi:hypothetical protein